MNKPWVTFGKCRLRELATQTLISPMTEQGLPREIEVYDVANRRLYAKTKGRTFALFEDELTPEELMAIAKDIADRRVTQCPDVTLNANAA